MDTARQRSWAASMSLNAIWRRRVGVGVGVGADRGTPAAAQLDHFEWMAATSSVAPSIVTTTD